MSKLYYFKANNELELNSYKDAIDDYSLSIKINPNIQTYLYRAVTYGFEENYKLAINDCETAISISKNDSKRLVIFYYWKAYFESELKENNKASDDNLIMSKLYPKYAAEFANLYRPSNSTNKKDYQLAFNSFMKSVPNYHSNEEKLGKLFC